MDIESWHITITTAANISEGKNREIVYIGHDMVTPAEMVISPWLLVASAFKGSMRVQACLRICGQSNIVAIFLLLPWITLHNAQQNLSVAQLFSPLGRRASKSVYQSVAGNKSERGLLSLCLHRRISYAATAACMPQASLGSNLLGQLAQLEPSRPG